MTNRLIMMTHLIKRIRRRGKSSLELVKKCPLCVDGRTREESAPRLSSKQLKAYHANGLAGKYARLQHVSVQVDLDFSEP